LVIFVEKFISGFREAIAATREFHETVVTQFRQTVASAITE